MLGLSGGLCAAAFAGAGRGGSVSGHSATIRSGAVTWTLSQPVEHGVTLDGVAWIVVPPGGVSILSRSPGADTVGAAAVSGTMLNPQVTQQGWDGRLGTYNAGLNLGFPLAVEAGDIVVGQVHRPGTGWSVRAGVSLAWSGLLCLDGRYPSATIAPALTGWTGRGTPQAYAFDVASAVAALPALPLGGIGCPSVATVLEHVDRLEIAWGAGFGTNTAHGYETMTTHGFGDSSNYGRYLGRWIGAAGLHLVGDLATPGQKRALLLAMVRHGVQTHDPIRGAASPLPADGGHHQFQFLPMAIALQALGRSADLDALAVTAGGNMMLQPFLHDAGQLADLLPHSDLAKPHVSRRRSITVSSGTDITVTTSRPASIAEGDAARSSFEGLDLVRESDGARARVTAMRAGTTTDGTDDAATIGHGNNVKGITIDAQPVPAFAAEDVVFFRAPEPVRAGDADWRVGGFPARINPGFAAPYRNLNFWADDVLALRAMGLWRADWDATEAYVLRAARADDPAPGRDYPPHWDQVGDTDFTRDFWNAHAADLIPTPVQGPITGITYTQSEFEFLLNPGSFYRQIAQPIPGDGNLVVWTQSGDGVAPVRTLVNAATVAAGQVNPAMAALSAFLAHVAPGRDFVLGDGSVPGTSRIMLHDGSDDDGRLWSDFTAVVDAIEAETGAPLGHLIDCWYNSDAAHIADFRNAFWPGYFGRTGADAAFTLGNTNAVTGAVVEHILWDGAADPAVKGRGIFARADTRWHVLTPMPFCDGPVSPAAEAERFSQGLRLEEPRRQVMIDLASDPLAQSVGLVVGPSAHVSDFGGGIHPVVDHPDGQILLMWPIAVALARAAGVTIGEPTIVGIEGDEGGAWAELLVDLPNGGSLTTLRQLRGTDMPGTPSPHQQEVTGIELSRGSVRRPVFRSSETGHPAAHRGTVQILDAGSGTPRRGRVRVTPEQPFAHGDSLSYLRGQATAMLLEPRDVANRLYLDQLIEHVPGLYDAAALYPFEGVAVRPYQEELAAPVPAPAFEPRSTRFNGTTSRLESASLSVPAAQEGTFAAWLYYDGTWNSPASAELLNLRLANGTAVFRVNTVSGGRIGVILAASPAVATFNSTPVNAFAGGRWHHVMVSYKAGAGGWYQMSIDGAAPINGPDLSGATLGMAAGIGRAFVGCQTSTANLWHGDLGYVYHNTQTALDLTVEANRRKFISAGGEPVHLGAQGELPTGTRPAFYLDGGAGMANLGHAGSLTPTALTAGSAPELP